MVLVRRLRVRDVRSHRSADVALGERLTVIHGPNGAGKTNLLEALYVGCTGRSCRTRNERELIRFDAPAARVELEVDAPDGRHHLAVGWAAGEAKRLSGDGAPVERLLDLPFRPLVSVFLPDRLELVKGPPALRRAHLDQLIAGLWPARAATRRAYAAALAQRNALLARVRAGVVDAAALRTWDLEVGRHALALREDRERAVALVAPRFAALAAELGLAGTAELVYRPRSQADSPASFADELQERLAGDLERGFTGHGPHRDELLLRRDRRELRVYGSQGEQRLALLALLIGEREALADERGFPPLLLLDDVMSELDAERRERLVTRVARGGQVVLTTTDAAHVPPVAGAEALVRLAVGGGVVLEEVPAP
jgi:DNA replication and repair protein RecF